MKQRYDSSIYLAGMQSINHLGATSIRQMTERFGGPFEAWCALQDPAAVERFDRISSKQSREITAEATEERLDYIWDKLQEWHITVITYLDVLFPARLQEIYNPPAVIFVRGNTDLLNNTWVRVAMVGARKCTDYGRNAARYIGRELGKYEVVIVSGGARGIDSHSHEGALESNGHVMVVMGCGLDVVYPAENKKLFDRVIRDKGILISEYPPGTPPKGQHFPARNRIISGLSDAVIVVEARSSSGSLITADMAVNEGRDIYVVPGNILSHVADGNHWLIRQGAQVLTSPEDIVQDYNLRLKAKRNTVDTSGVSMLSCNLEISAVLDSIPTDTPVSVDEIMKKTGLSLQRIHCILLDLELKRAIEKTRSHGYIRIFRSDTLVH